MKEYLEDTSMGNYLKSERVNEKHILSINLENPEYNFITYMDLYKYVDDKITDNEKYYIFLDEVQNIEGFEKAVDGLYIKKNVDLYITGSNAFLLSSELAILLSGRYIEIKMFPLSYSEYLSYYKKENSEKMYLNYTNRSSFPYALKIEEQSDIDKYIDAIYNTIIVRDVLARKKYQIWVC